MSKKILNKIQFIFLTAALFVMSAMGMFNGCNSTDKTLYEDENYSFEELENTNASNEKIKLAYIRGTWKFGNGRYFTADDIQGNLLTDLNICFAVVSENYEIVLENKNHIKEQVKKLHEKFPELRVNISVGGAGADNFSTAAANPVNRKIFCDSALKLIEELNFNGIDIDWEYPVGPDWGQEISSDEHDRQGYILLLNDLRKALNELQASTGKKYAVSSAVPCSWWFTEKNDVKSAARVCNYLNLMCYDYYGDWNKTTGHNANIYKNENDPEGWSSDAGLNRYIDCGVPENKIVMGMPFYSLVWKNVEKGKFNGLFEASGTFFEAVDYEETKEKYSEGFTEYWDEQSKASYKYNAEQKVFISYAGVKMVQEICSYVRQKNFAGVMYWEYGHDLSAELLKEINLQE